MKEAFPDHYRIHFGEQVRRIGGLMAAGGRALTGRGATNEGDGEGRGSPKKDRSDETKTNPDQDRFREPLFLAIWYAGLLTGYLRGPARSHATTNMRRP